MKFFDLTKVESFYAKQLNDIGKNLGEKSQKKEQALQAIIRTFTIPASS